MRDEFRADLRAHVVTDEQGKVRQVLYTGDRWLPSVESPRRAAVEYVQSQAGLLEIEPTTLDRLHELVTYMEPRRREGASYRFAEEKEQFDSATVAFAQTYDNVPVWRTGITVTIKREPSRVVESTDTTLPNVAAVHPSDDTIARWQRLFEGIERRPAVVGEEMPAAIPADREIRAALGLTGRRGGRGAATTPAAPSGADLRVNRGRFFVYRYDPEERQPRKPAIGDQTLDLERDDVELTFALPSVPQTIRPNRDYFAAEVVFTLPFAGIPPLNWRALIELETNTVLYLRALIAGVNGLVFTYDPITSTGVLANTAGQSNATLDPLRDDVTLQDLNGPVAGTQSLGGTNVRVSDDDAPTIAPPTEATGTDFDYHARTNNFAAVSAYYHANNVFAVIEDLGFNLSSYFGGTTFPVHVDHRASLGDPTNGIEINAYCGGDAQGDGIGLVGYCLSDTADTTNPLGRAVDKYVHWHEIGGHGILFDHVSSGSFGFAHSAGDSLAALQNDPESLLRELNLIERFRYAPFRQIRWMNRDVATSWGWGGSSDIGGYQSEEILATTHFRIYRSIGGDSTNLGRRWFASRVMTYLILRAVGDLTPMTNPANALAWCNRLMATDLLDWTSEGLSGGAYNKVIRWAFEEQGLFQPPGAPTPVTTAGAPPAVDVYIEDGRGGEYQHQPVHWANTSIWNRNAADALPGHQSAIEGQPNYAYVKIKNRGTLPATQVTVKGYHCLPGAGLTWPNDFTAMFPAGGIVAPSVPANNALELTVGPFEWQPNINVGGHDCLLMIASVFEDPSNVDNFSPGETIAEWRLVPNDNNVGQRNVQVVSGQEGSEGLMQDLDGQVFFAGNTSIRRATMQLMVELPELLRAKNWKVRFHGLAKNRFVLGPREKRMLTIELIPGDDFTTDDVTDTSDRDISVTLLSDDMVLGGMTYRLDPLLKPRTRKPKHGRDCRKPARDLLRCLDIDAKNVRDVRVTKVSIDVRMDDDCC
jgi:hypothetical protein